MAFAQAEDLSDRQAVLQKALDLPSLQSYYLKNADDSYAPVYVMQHPVAFDAGIEVKKFGKSVEFLQRREVTPSVRSYFLFHQFDIEGNKATVQADFYFQSGQGELKQVRASIKLSKADGQWTISASELKND